MAADGGAEFRPYEIINAEADPSILILCDHASNAIPPNYDDLGVARADLDRHIAYDVGAEGLTRALARHLDAPAVLSRFSRLLIDPNRGEDDPTLVMRISDGAVVPGNRHVDDAERERRLERYHRPYHRAVETVINRAERALGHSPALLSVHSFTPQLQGRPKRPWHIGVLWSADVKTAQAVFEGFGRDSNIIVGDNEPYGGALEGDTMWRHGERRGARHVLIELRNDLIMDEEQQLGWAASIAPILDEALRRP